MPELPAGWRYSALSEIVELQRGFDLPSHNRHPGPYPVLTSGEGGGSHDEARVAGPGFVVGRATNIGRPKWSSGDFWPHNTTMFAKDFKGNSPRWLYHLFEATDLSGFDSGSVQPMLNRNYVAQVQVAVPPVSEQVAIAEVLTALDDKIAANTAVAAKLSSVAMWELTGSLRDGHVDVTIAEVAILVVRGITPQYVETEYVETEGATRVLNQKCVRDQSVSLEPSRWTSPSRVRPEKLLRRDDVLVNSTGQGTLGRVARWSNSETATVDSHITIVRPDPSVCATSVIGQAILAIEADIEALGEGSTGQTELSRIQLGQAHIRLPRAERAQTLGLAIDALVDRADAAREENLTLAATRDALLPQLMSGKLRVRDAEAIAADAGA
ncbi:restriction endonuclease subunit S [uncultured Microbacterium sp.]|uniref:restriction endonuclease subunit S n=1 Tax=uncultured Microbacterium sp. TaxID=191216 RepID=UPI0025EFDE77|nr:restriction endonuclease subunit S [uncultured Microbacterium sp.]